MVRQLAAASEVVTRQMDLLASLGDAAQNLAERAKNLNIDAPERAALRNQARCANEAAGALLARGAIELFNQPPGDAAKKINDAVAKTTITLKRIKETGNAIAFVGALIGVAAAVLTGDWFAVAED